MATIEYATEGHVAVITINRPEARNAVNGDVATGIEEAIDRLEADDSLWLGILTGVPPVFCAGADLKEINAGRADALQTKRGGFGGIARRERTKPVIAAVDGPALAGGTEICLSCDMIVASTTATFGIPEVKRCLVAAGGGLFRLPRKIPAMDRARRIEANAPVAVRASRRVILESMTADEATGWKLSGTAFAEALGSEDSKEGLVAFIEKRPPEWKGR